MRSRSRITAGWTALVLAVALAAPSAIFAVTDEEIFRDFRFNLNNPGARSMGLGGAFIAVADDATASLANPAGLTLLARPEFFTEIRDTKPDSSSIEQSFGASQGIFSSTEPRAVLSPSFVSYVYPFKKYAVGVSRVELNKNSNVTASKFSVAFDPNNPSIIDTLGGTGAIDTDLSVWNVTGAMKLGDKISIGATASIGILSMRSNVTNTLTNSDPNSLVPNTPETLYTTAIDHRDTDTSFNAGVHYRPFSKLSFGAVYRGGLKFKMPELIANDGFFGGGFGASFKQNPLETTFNTPDSWGAGASWRPMSALTVSLDWVHIQYTDVLKGFQSGLNVLTIFDQAAKFKVNDADEFHLGGEWVFTAGSVPWAVRGGAYSEHNSRIFADFQPSGTSSFSNDHSFPGRDTITHWTGGTGVVVKDRFQIDAAADISRIAKQYVISTIFRF